MDSYLRHTILAGVALGMFGLIGCETERPQQPAPTPPVQATSAQSGSAQERNPLVCPDELRAAAQEACQIHNAYRENEREQADYVAFMSVFGTPLPICGCAEVSVCPPDEDCPLSLAGRPFVSHKALLGATVDGSHCEDVCTFSNGGTAVVDKRCVKACKKQHN